MKYTKGSVIKVGNIRDKSLNNKTLMVAAVVEIDDMPYYKFTNGQRALCRFFDLMTR